MKRKTIILIGCGVVILVGLVLLLLTTLAVFSFTDLNLPQVFRDKGQPPEVAILYPTDSMILTSGQILFIEMQVTAPQGLAHVAFLEDGEEAGRYEPTDSPQEQRLSYPWQSSAAGKHRISVIAYDLRGQASDEVFVDIGVQAIPGLPEIPAGAEIPGAVASLTGEDSEINPGEQEQDNGCEDQQQAGEQDGAQGGEQDEQEGGDQPLDLPPQPQDDPPQILSFDSIVNMADAGDGGAALSITVQGSVSDDIGLDRLDVFWNSPAGEIGDTSVLCLGQRDCTIDIRNDQPAAGVWVYKLNAWDTSGQSASALEWIEIVGAEGQPPAAAEHDDGNNLFFDFQQLQLQGIVEPLNQEQGVIDAEALFEMMQALGVIDAPEAVQASGRCLDISVQPQAAGNLVTMQVICDLDVEEEHILFPYIIKTHVNSGDRGTYLFIDSWYDPARRKMTTGETYSWLDEDITCGTDYLYNGRVDRAVVIDPHSRHFASVARDMSIGRVEAEVTSFGCSPGSIADVNLQADLHADGIAVTWSLPPEGVWQADIPEQGITFSLTRHNSQFRETLIIYRESIPADQVIPGKEYIFIDDDAGCNAEYWYTLSAIASDADLDLVSPGWLMHAQTCAPNIRCPWEDLRSMELGLTPYWFNPSLVKVRMEADIPAGLDWPAGDGVELLVLRMKRFVEGCEVMPCAGNWTIKNRIPVTNEIRTEGLSFTADDHYVDFNQKYVYALGVMVNGELVETGPGILVTIPTSPPPPPQITRLTVTDRNCPGGVPRCVVVEWQSYEQPSLVGFYSQAARIVVERIIGDLDRQEFEVGLDDTSFVDTTPFMQSFNLADGSTWHVCRYTTTYRLKAYDDGGHWYGAFPLTVDMPDCDEPVNITVERNR